jgi:hypothetical protein
MAYLTEVIIDGLVTPLMTLHHRMRFENSLIFLQIAPELWGCSPNLSLGATWQFTWSENKFCITCITYQMKWKTTIKENPPTPKNGTPSQPSNTQSLQNRKETTPLKKNFIKSQYRLGCAEAPAPPPQTALVPESWWKKNIYLIVDSGHRTPKTKPR